MHVSAGPAWHCFCPALMHICNTNLSHSGKQSRIRCVSGAMWLIGFLYLNTLSGVLTVALSFVQIFVFPYLACHFSRADAISLPRLTSVSPHTSLHPLWPTWHAHRPCKWMSGPASGCGEPYPPLSNRLKLSLSASPSFGAKKPHKSQRTLMHAHREQLPPPPPPPPPSKASLTL